MFLEMWVTTLLKLFSLFSMRPLSLPQHTIKFSLEQVSKVTLCVEVWELWVKEKKTNSGRGVASRNRHYKARKEVHS